MIKAKANDEEKKKFKALSNLERKTLEKSLCFRYIRYKYSTIQKFIGTTD